MSISDETEHFAIWLLKDAGRYPELTPQTLAFHIWIVETLVWVLRESMWEEAGEWATDAATLH